jgi:ABC-type anion transport system duplicated permease subunit
MNATNIGIICTILGVACTIISIVIIILGYKRTATKDIREESNSQTKLEMQLSYISRGVDDIKLDMKLQDKKINDVIERVAKVEESTKSAHHRLDNYEKEGIKNGNN